MGKHQYRLSCEFHVSPESFISVANKLEISIPCINCHRYDRTILFEDVHEKGICTPPNKCDGFPGKLTSREIIKKPDSIEVNYLIDFNYQPFFDQIDKEESNFKFGWARVKFTLKCQKIKKIITTQENLRRPWSVKCICENVIYKENKSPFNYNVIEIN